MITLQKQFLELVLPRMAIAASDRILDLGCGDGWACRAMAALASEGLVVGIDASGDAIREARRLSIDSENILYIQAEAEENPWQDNFFSQVVMIDAFGEVRDVETALGHVRRVMSPGGRFWALVSSHAEEFAQRLASYGFVDSLSEALAVSDATTTPQLIAARKS